MKITSRRDYNAGTVQVVMDMHLGADPDAMADLAWASVERELTAAKKARGTVPPGMARTPIRE